VSATSATRSLFHEGSASACRTSANDFWTITVNSPEFGVVEQVGDGDITPRLVADTGENSQRGE
jgi:hypothetical protein